MRRAKIRGAFSDLEQEVMEIVWKRGRASADQIRADLAPARELKESTVRTILSRLEEKGHLRHTVAGRSYLYAAAETPEKLAARAVRQIVDKLCSGSVEQLVAGMVTNDLIAPEDLKRLAEKIARARQESQKGDAK